ncbi:MULTISPECIES: PaaX family transcriptional regulator C-terminal domain-containing protein [Sulfitobacter]|uniref:PaaX family transcriptional regulator C-terminal domain-containing protein n=1 Tax=Sulfitobacter TaxID=60136 RepID=UPI00230736EA|nr:MULTISPECIES: PaaX family transcriptional regulator C-terminal domain-containing protein [Sulfitobacter]MDF3381910.1 PaaX family transcriptional regulator [Sulfitobacter sp. Ks11]MDF3385329.1 PaaX family transcriptional regulator [Sulfitobacter sp. M85]MDF3388748.1 PaaX family transcriptional regulator [Sulfitobacter sp. Ks16]MDF3399385.1 PaaX family transcriptional regulator [Sulfitobacter sp. KE39]MDF3402806.1 PaaX family transcriptional regulator [Sulfitobacter sp. Ks35]
MPSDHTPAVVAALAGLGGQRVWSLMVSLFGDLAQGEGDAIDGPVLSQIMAALDVRPEASRVALHRLRNDGWLQSHKVGRISQHSLTAQGRAESAAASPRIYAAPPELTEPWQMVLTEENGRETDSALRGAGFISALPRAYVGRAESVAPEGCLALPGTPPPDWLRRAVEPAELEADYAALLVALTGLDAELPDPEQFTALDVAVLRCLIVHNWRRLVLKHPTLPGGLIRPEWPGYRCHLLVDRLLRRYPRPALQDLATA